jgi:hypothetical protein
MATVSVVSAWNAAAANGAAAPTPAHPSKDDLGTKGWTVGGLKRLADSMGITDLEA